MVNTIKSYINIIDNSKINKLDKNDYEKLTEKFSIENCNKEAKEKNKKFFFSGNNLDLNDYDCYIGNNDIPFTTELNKIDGYLYKITDDTCNKSFSECLIDSQTKYFNEKKNNELRKLAKTLAFKNHLVYNLNYDNLYSKYISRIDAGFETLQDGDLIKKNIINQLIKINEDIKKQQIKDLNKGDEYEENKNKIIEKYKENLDDIKTKIDNLTIETKNQDDKVGYLKIISSIIFLLMIILIFYYIFNNSKNKNIINKFNFE